MMTTCRALIGALALFAAAVPAAASPLEVAVTNVPQARGRIHVDICTDKTFITSDCPYTMRVPAVAGTTIVSFADIPPGRYAAQVFQDLVGDDKVHRNLFGIPKDLMGFSRDAPTPFRAPHFEEAAFDHGTESQRITLKLRKLP